MIRARFRQSLLVHVAAFLWITQLGVVIEMERWAAGRACFAQPPTKNLSDEDSTEDDEKDVESRKAPPANRIQPESANGVFSPGGNPLAGRSGSLDELFGMPDWSTVVPSPALPDPAVRQTIEALIGRRNQIIDGCSFFKTVETIWQEEVELVRRLEVNRVAAINLNAANARLQQVVAMGIHGEKFLPAARDQQRVAKDTLQKAVGNVVLQREKLHPLYHKIGENLGPLMQVYHDMRRLLVPDRRDPNRAAVLAELELATARRDDFYEGRVLAAMAQAYDGNTAAAEMHLTAASVGLDRYALYGTPWAADCCLAYLFLGQPGNVETYVARLKRLDSKRQTPLICWLVGQAEMLEGKDTEAKKYFERALSRAGFYDKKQPPVPEPLLGDVAFFYATAKNDTIRNLDKAKALLERVPEQSDRWEVLRARAALLAAEDDKTAARATLDACRERAPGTLLLRTAPL